MADGQDLITELSNRLRDPSNTRHSRATVRDVLTHCQRVLNYQQESIITGGALTTVSGRTLYRTTEVASNVGRVTTIRNANRDLHEVDWRSLVHNDRHWLRRIGQDHELFARIGGNLLVIYPARETGVGLNVEYVRSPDDVVDGATAVDLPDDQMPALLDMGELVLSVRARKLEGLEEIFRRLAKELRLPDKFGNKEVAKR